MSLSGSGPTPAFAEADACVGRALEAGRTKLGQSSSWFVGRAPVRRTLVRRALAGATISCLFVTASAAHAQDEDVCPGADLLQVDVEPSPWDEALARRVTEQLFSELRARPPCPPSPKEGEPSPIHVDVRWIEPKARGRVVVELRGARKEYQALRDLDVERIPPDGLPLAIAIAADELLRALTEQASREVEAPRPVRPPPAPVVVAAPPPRPVEKKREDTFGVGLRFSLDAFTSGLVLGGNDTVLEAVVASHVDVGLRGGLRAVLAFDRPGDAESRVHSAVVGGGFVRVGLNRPRDALGLAASLDVQGLWLRADVSQATVPEATVPEATVRATALVMLGVSAWAPIAPGLRATFDASVGAPLAPITLDVGQTSVQAVHGVSTMTSLGVLATF